LIQTYFFIVRPGLKYGGDVSGPRFREILAKAASLLHEPLPPEASPSPKPANAPTSGQSAWTEAPSPEALAASYGLTWADFEAAGCAWEPYSGAIGGQRNRPGVSYPYQSPKGTARKFKTASRLNGKREVRVAPSGLGAGLFWTGGGPEAAAGKTLVLGGGEEKCLAATLAGFPAVCPYYGEGGKLSDWQAAQIVQARPARLVVAFDADDTGRAGARAKAFQLTALGLEAAVVEWPASAQKGADLNNLLLEGGAEAVRSAIAQAVVPAPAPAEAQGDALAAMDAAAERAAVIVDLDLDDPIRRWEARQPCDLDSPEPAPFPVEALPASLARMAQAMAEATKSAVDIAVASVLSVLSLATVRRLVVQIKPRWIDPCGLYIAFIGDPGSGKTPNLSLAKGPLAKRTAEAQRRREDQPDLLEVRVEVAEKKVKALRADLAEAVEAEDEALEEQIQKDLRFAKQRLGEAREALSSPHFYVADTTIEQLAARMDANKGRFAILDSEGSIFGILSGRYNKTNAPLELLLSAWSGEDYSVERKGDGKGKNRIDLPQTRLSVGVAFQSTVMEEIADNKRLAGRGLLDRFLYFLPKVRRLPGSITSEPVNDAAANRYERVIEKILSLPEEIEFHLDKQALSALDQFERETIEEAQSEMGSLRGIEGWAYKLPQQAARLAAMFAAVDAVDAGLDLGQKKIHAVGQNAMERAIEVCRYFIEHARLAFNLMAFDRGCDSGIRWEEGRTWQGGAKAGRLRE
jgi:hypothetical protein